MIRKHETTSPMVVYRPNLTGVLDGIYGVLSRRGIHAVLTVVLLLGVLLGGAGSVGADQVEFSEAFENTTHTVEKNPSDLDVDVSVSGDGVEIVPKEYGETRVFVETGIGLEAGDQITAQMPTLRLSPSPSDKTRLSIGAYSSDYVVGEQVDEPVWAISARSDAMKDKIEVFAEYANASEKVAQQKIGEYVDDPESTNVSLSFRDGSVDIVSDDGVLQATVPPPDYEFIPDTTGIVARITPPRHPVETNLSISADSVAFAPDGRLAVGYSGGVDVFNSSYSKTGSVSADDTAFGVAFAPDGRLAVADIAVLGSSGHVDVYDASLTLSQTLSSRSLTAAFRDDGSLVTAPGTSLQIRNATDPSTVESTISLSSVARSVDYAPDDRLLVALKAGEIQIREADSLAVAETISVNPRSVSWDSNSRFAVAVDGSPVQIREREIGSGISFGILGGIGSGGSIFPINGVPGSAGMQIIAVISVIALLAWRGSE